MRYLATLPYLIYILWILATGEAYSSESDVFLSVTVPSSLVCETLCKYTTRCASYTWGIQPRKCHLHSQQQNTRNGFPRIKGNDETAQTGVCISSHCGEEEICLPVNGGITAICAAISSFGATGTASTSTSSDTATQPTVSSTASTTAAVTTATTTTTASTTTIASNAAVRYRGCYKDDLNRVLDAVNMTSYQLTPKVCWKFCLNRRMPYFGLEAGAECFCGVVIKAGYKMIKDSSCSMPCKGNMEVNCGGNWMISIFEIN